MEYTELSAYDVGDGVVTTWTPAATDAWRHDDRPLSPGHTEHLDGDESGSWIGSIMRVPFRFDADTLRRTLATWCARHEALRTTPVALGGGWARHTLPSDAVDVIPCEIGWLGRGHASRFLTDHFEQLSPRTWPHLVFASVADPDRADFLLAFGADHSVMDAYSQLLWFDEIVDLYTAELGRQQHREVAVGSHVDHAAREFAAAGAIDPAGEAVMRWRDYLGPGLAFPRFPVADVELPAGVRRPQTSISVPLVDLETTARLNAVCRDLGTSAQSAVLAALGHALRRSYGVDRLRTILPMHTRSRPEDVAAVGWYVGLCPLDVDLADLRTVPALISAVHDAVAAGKDLVRYPFSRVSELLGGIGGPTFAVSYVDTRYVAGNDRWEAWEARALRSATYSHEEVYLWFSRDAEGLRVSGRYPATVGAERAMRTVLGGIIAFLEAVADGVVELDLGVWGERVTA